MQFYFILFECGKSAAENLRENLIHPQLPKQEIYSTDPISLDNWVFKRNCFSVCLGYSFVMIRIYLYLILLFFLNSCASPGQVALESEDKFDSLTSDFIETCTSIKGVDDQLEAMIIFSTQDCYKSEGGIFRMVWNDQFLRGYVSKSTKSILSVQVYSTIYYSQPQDWIYPYQANYLINDELISDDGISIDSDVDCSMSSTYGNCIYKDDYGFDLDLRIFEEARRLKAEGIQVFNYRIKTKAGVDVNRIFNVEEIIGLENKMNSLLLQL